MVAGIAGDTCATMPNFQSLSGANPKGLNFAINSKKGPGSKMADFG